MDSELQIKSVEVRWKLRWFPHIGVVGGVNSYETSRSFTSLQTLKRFLEVNHWKVSEYRVEKEVFIGQVVFDSSKGVPLKMKSE